MKAEALKGMDDEEIVEFLDIVCKARDSDLVVKMALEVCNKDRRQSDFAVLYNKVLACEENKELLKITRKIIKTRWTGSTALSNVVKRAKTLQTKEVSK